MGFSKELQAHSYKQQSQYILNLENFFIDMFVNAIGSKITENDTGKVQSLSIRNHPQLRLQRLNK